MIFYPWPLFYPILDVGKEKGDVNRTLVVYGFIEAMVDGNTVSSYTCCSI